MVNLMSNKFDVCVVGSGLAGLTVALSLPGNLKVCVLSRSQMGMNASSYAQGGIAAVIDEFDSAESHVEDTLISGAGICCANTVKFFIENSSSVISWLEKQGVIFSKNSDGVYSLTREGGHSHSRIVHSFDETGKEIMAVLQQNATKSKNISLLYEFQALDFVMKEGKVQALACADLSVNEYKEIQAKSYVLATGGASGIYLNCSNPDSPHGDGMAIAWRAGCSLANLEFNQFHPTCIYNNADRPFLVSEALRGEGGVLCDSEGNSFMSKYHPKAELATRDVVANSMLSEMKKTGKDYVYLDISHKNAKWLKSRFPAIYRGCKSYGIDITKDKIPVSPASHYSCGGIVVDINCATDIDGIYAVGECAYTGLHGANRLASNSLLECLVAGLTCANSIVDFGLKREFNSNYVPRGNIECARCDYLSQAKQIKKLMWDYVGVVRTYDGMKFAQEQIISIHNDLEEVFNSNYYDADLASLRNLVLISRLTIDFALSRKESRGGHFYQDYPDKSDASFNSPTIMSNNKKFAVIS